MHARLSTYTIVVEDRARYREALAQGGAAPQVAEMLLGLEGCRGAWVLAEDTEREADLDTFSETFLSLWDTKEQAELVRDRLGPRVAQVLGSGGASLSGAPNTQVLVVLAGRPG